MFSFSHIRRSFIRFFTFLLEFSVSIPCRCRSFSPIRILCNCGFCLSIAYFSVSHSIHKAQSGRPPPIAVCYWLEPVSILSSHIMRCHEYVCFIIYFFLFMLHVAARCLHHIPCPHLLISFRLQKTQTHARAHTQARLENKRTSDLFSKKHTWT